jgi:hypothetical protein
MRYWLFYQTLRIHDATTGAPFYAKPNARRCRFTHLAWSLARHELYLVDAAGYLQIWNVYANVCVHTARLREGLLRCGQRRVIHCHQKQ